MADQKVAVVLVHGIGKQVRRATISGFLQALARLGYAPASEEQKLREPAGADPGFAYLTTESSIGDQPITVAEFHWSDLSHIRTGFLSALFNFFQFIVDAPDIIYSCLGPRLLDGGHRDDMLLRCLRVAIAVALWLIYFPIMAINLAYGAYVAAFALHVKLGTGITPGSIAVTSAVVTSVVCAGAIGTALKRSTLLLNPYIRALAAMTLLIFCGTFLACLIAPGRAQLTYRGMAFAFNGTLDMLWLVVQACTLLYLLSMPALLVFFWRRRKSVLLGFAAMFLVVRFWLLLITTIWLIFLTTVFDRGTYASLIGDIGGPILFISLLWFDLAAVGLAMLGALGVHIWRTRISNAGYLHAGFPRLIVPDAVLVLTLVLAVGGIVTICWCNCAMIWPGCRQIDCGFVYGSSAWIISNATALLAIGGIAIQVVHSRFESVLDIVNYFRSDRGHRQVNPLKAVSTTFFYRPGDAVEFRPRIRARLDTLIQDLNRTQGPFDRIVFVTHSLGSMFVIEALKDWHRRGDKLGRIDLVTLGSPYRTIFGHFFPHMFEPARADLLPNLASWINIHRANDYVGTTLTDGADGVLEVVHPAYGHADYLRSDDVVAEIARLVFDYPPPSPEEEEEADAPAANPGDALVPEPITEPVTEPVTRREWHG